MDTPSIFFALSEGNPGALNVLIAYANTDPMGVLGLLIFDTKRLYGSRIWELYSDICGKDIERFRYHVDVELPNQETGELTTTGPFAPSSDNSEFWKKRQSGKPDSFWALDNPPTTPDYDYPII